MTQTIRENKVVYGEYQNFSVDYFMDHLKAMADAIPEGYRASAIVELETKMDWDSPSGTLVLCYDRPETPLEEQQRLGRAIAEQNRKDETDRDQYERLKAKFEPSTA